MNAGCVLICGASGILGRGLCKYFDELDIAYIGTFFSKTQASQEGGAKDQRHVYCDCTDPLQVKTLFELVQPSVCINCVAHRFIEQCENDWDATKRVNVQVPSILSVQCNLYGTHLVHISTDYVFDGMSPPYYPDSSLNPLQNYGMSKAIAEMRIKATCKQYSIIRVPVLYTDCFNSLAETAITAIARKVMQSCCTHYEDNYSVRRPIFIPDLCKFIHHVIKEACCRHPQDTYHFVHHTESFTKYEIATLIASFLQKPHIHIVPLTESPSATRIFSNRPFDTYLKDNERDLGKFDHTPLVSGIQQCLQRYFHPHINDPAHAPEVFLLLDLDGTLVDSEKVHVQCYEKALCELGFHTPKPFGELLENAGEHENVDGLLLKITNNDMQAFHQVKLKKNECLHQTNILTFMPGMELLVNLITTFSMNHVVVTNTCRANVDHFMKLLPALSGLKNWITREDYTHPKPHEEPYLIAKQKYWKNERYVIGFENSREGYTSLAKITDIIYIMSPRPGKEMQFFKEQDVYLINEFTSDI